MVKEDQTTNNSHSAEWHLSQMKCTRIMISQRPENLRHCDRIIQLTA